MSPSFYHAFIPATSSLRRAHTFSEPSGRDLYPTCTEAPFLKVHIQTSLTLT